MGGVPVIWIAARVRIKRNLSISLDVHWEEEIMNYRLNDPEGYKFNTHKRMLRRRFILVSLVLLISILACNMPAGNQQPTPTRPRSRSK